ncbi:MOSC and FAD-binding oxidoreductase domain-containing protein [Streptantibioticus ferralitis]|uniref:MOSC and FAD-binding oxidoreductase domain-containing protein n=1 Tax=Streptantibioticus ferralitis TaxID=236510 RepID=A0ABT5YYV2_9ACTN|nr:MOSC and FAD-binding oxidoreductase domain-containing protein [Streptantibioticus ferralitis]MDF2256777.1 MOSC and FAD-binding oxidoreductase domain-containing protein [Streptantibioticus ferralitis]
MATLLSVNVGLPKDVRWHGRTTHTGVWKQPVTGPRTVRRLNVDGDGQGDLAGHGGEQRAVLVYQIDSYRYWQEQLKRDDFTFGQFGENFTVDGLPDDEVCIGDRYRIGSAVFEVTQPRVTCYRVGLRMDEPQMAALLVAHARPGFYFRVLTEGEVEAGDEIVKVASGPGQMTVAEIDALLYMPGHERSQVERALRIPALSPGWKSSMQSLLEEADRQPGATAGNAGLTSAAVSPPPAWPGFRSLKVSRIDPESSSIFSITMASTDGSPLPAALPGQFITVRLRPDANGPPLIRSYSLSGRPGAAEYRISVKQEPHGAASTYLREHLAVGDVLEVAAPRGTFTLARGTVPVLLLSAGVGATPVLAMLHALADADSRRPVWWLHGARDSRNHPFADETRALLARLPNSRAYISYSRPRDGDRAGIDYTTAGRLSAESIRGLDPPQDADAYICGPTAFMEDMTNALGACGLAADRIRTEAFGALSAITPGIAPQAGKVPHQPAHPPGQAPGPTVSFARSGLAVPWHPGYGTLLELAEACDIPVRWSCRTGVCHTCETAVLLGRVDYSPEPIEAPAEGNALICCSRPSADLVLDM